VRQDLVDEARKQAVVGAYNDRVAGSVAPTDVAELFCTCGRPGCDEVLFLTPGEYRVVQERPYRFLVAPEHATEVDEVVLSTGEYDVVELREGYRHVVDEQR
jgi:hypothetical protein